MELRVAANIWGSGTLRAGMVAFLFCPLLIKELRPLFYYLSRDWLPRPCDYFLRSLSSWLLLIISSSLPFLSTYLAKSEDWLVLPRIFCSFDILDALPLAIRADPFDDRTFGSK